MLPLKDENPTHRRPVVTVLLILGCLWVYFGWQPTPGPTVDVPTEAGTLVFDEATAFSFARAAIPCEVIHNRPLTVGEIIDTFEQTPGAQMAEVCRGPAAGEAAAFPDKSVWLSLFTSMFLHGGLLHLGGNLLFLWIFGNNIEDHLGHFRFLVFYLVGGVVASAAHIALNTGSTIPVVGASGAIAGVMGAYLVWFPNAPVRTAIIVFFFVTLVDLRAKWLLIFWFVTQFFTSPNSGVAWAAHVGGFVFGVVIGIVVRSSRAVRRASWTKDHRDEMRRGWDSTGGVGRSPYHPRRLGPGSR